MSADYDVTKRKWPKSRGPSVRQPKRNKSYMVLRAAKVGRSLGRNDDNARPKTRRTEICALTPESSRRRTPLRIPPRLEEKGRHATLSRPRVCRGHVLLLYASLWLIGRLILRRRTAQRTLRSIEANQMLRGYHVTSGSSRRDSSEYSHEVYIYSSGWAEMAHIYRVCCSPS